MLTTREAAAILGVHDSRIRQLILNGSLKAERFGWQWLISEQVVKQLQRRPAGRPKVVDP